MVALPVETLMYLCEFVWLCSAVGVLFPLSLFSSLSSWSHLLKDSDMCPLPT